MPLPAGPAPAAGRVPGLVRAVSAAPGMCWAGELQRELDSGFRVMKHTALHNKDRDSTALSYVMVKLAD